MSCMFLPGGDAGSPEIRPLPFKALADLQAEGLRALHAAFPQLAQAKPPLEQFVGAAVRPDSRPFYLTVLAPADAAASPQWRGGFYAPFGFFHVRGSLEGRPYSASASLLEVSASLVLEDKEIASAQWTVIGPNAGAAPQNAEAMIQSIRVATSGPHAPADVRGCIARHAPLSSWGEPRAVTARQCGVALACLVEAVC